MRIEVDWNNSTKQYEATPLTRGRKPKINLSTREASVRVFGFGKTRDAALTDCLKKVGFKPANLR